MPMIETKDGILLDIEDGVDPNSPEVRQAVQQERNRRFREHMAKPEQQAKVSKQVESDRAQYDPTNDMGLPTKVMANLGAGIADAKMGIDQLRGKATGKDFRDKTEIDRRLSAKTPGGRLLQGIGATVPAAAATLGAAALAPEAMATVGAGALGGALAGLANPVGSDDLLTGKAISTGLGAVTGGAANKYLPTAIPKVAGAIGNVAGKVADFGRRFTGGGRQKIAERVFGDTVGDKAATIKALRSHRDIPGTQPTTAQITGDRAMLETERKIAESGGEGASELGRRAEAGNKARYEFMADEFKGDPKAARQAASDFADANKPKVFTQPFRPQPVLGEITRLKNLSSNPAVHDMLDGLAERVRAAAASKNPVDQLHQIRMFEIDDRLSALASSDRKLAGAMRKELMGVKKALDNQLDRATGGGWKTFLSGYEDLARQADQVEAGAELMTKVNSAAPDVTGTPSVSAARQRVLRKEAPIDTTTGVRGPALDDFGKPKYSDTGQATINDVLDSLDTAARTQSVRPAGSATAANQAQPTAQQTAQQVLAPVMGKPAQGGIGPATRALVGGTIGTGAGALLGGGPTGAMIGGAAGGALVSGVDQALAHQSADVAKRLLTLYADPGAALMALQRAVKSGQVPFKLAESVARMIQNPGAMVGGASAQAMTPQPQQQPPQQ